MVIDIGAVSKAELFQVVGASGSPGALPCLTQSRHEDSGKNGDNGDDDKQLDEGELPGDTFFHNNTLFSLFTRNQSCILLIIT